MTKYVIYRISIKGRKVKIGFVEAENNADALLKAFKEFPSCLDRSQVQNGLIARIYGKTEPTT